jgi:hypothetical protein
MFDATSAQVAKELRHVFIRQRLAGFEFHNEFTLDEQVRKVVAKDSPVFVQHLQWMLLAHLNARLAKAIRQTILVNLLQMAMAQVAL